MIPSHLKIRAGLTIAVAAMLSFVAADASAVEGCKAVIAKNGVIRVSAKNIVGTPVWGPSLAGANIFFANTPTCHVGANLKNCELGQPGEVAQITPPELCRIFVADASGQSCSAFLKGCTPGQRPGGGFVKKSGDRMTGDLELDGDLTIDGDVQVDLDTKGIVKAVVHVFCSNNADQVEIRRSINTVNNGSFAIDDGALPGRCELTLPFSPSGRIIQPTTLGNAFVFMGINGNTLEFARTEMFVPGLPTGSDGPITVTVY
jgi:hypothetical protein